MQDNITRIPIGYTSSFYFDKYNDMWDEGEFVSEVRLKFSKKGHKKEKKYEIRCVILITLFSSFDTLKRKQS